MYYHRTLPHKKGLSVHYQNRVDRSGEEGVPLQVNGSGGFCLQSTVMCGPIIYTVILDYYTGELLDC